METVLGVPGTVVNLPKGYTFLQNWNPQVWQDTHKTLDSWFTFSVFVWRVCLLFQLLRNFDNKKYFEKKKKKKEYRISQTQRQRQEDVVLWHWSSNGRPYRFLLLLWNGHFVVFNHNTMLPDIFIYLRNVGGQYVLKLKVHFIVKSYILFLDHC